MTVSINGTSGIVFNDASTQNTAATGFGFKNRIINGAMVIDQRNAGASVTNTAAYVFGVDRWKAYGSQASKFTMQQNAGSVTPPVGFTNYLGITSSSAYSVGATEQFFVTQLIEGYNIADLGWGTANAKTITVSFQVYSSLTGTFGGTISNSGGSRNYPFSYTVSSANTWTTITISVSGDTSGTWLTTNGIGIFLQFNLGMGSTYSGTAGAWTASAIFGPTGATSVVGTNGATFYITGVQLEKGSTATSFDYRPYTTELQLCQRYLPAITLTGSNAICSAYNTATTTSVGIFHFLVTPRTPPTGITATAASGFAFSSAANFTASAIAFADASPVAGKFTLTISGGTAGQGGYIYGSNGAQILFTGCEL